MLTQAHFLKVSQLAMSQCTIANHRMQHVEMHWQDPQKEVFIQNKLLNQLSLLHNFSTACQLNDFFVPRIYVAIFLRS